MKFTFGTLWLVLFSAFSVFAEPKLSFSISGDQDTPIGQTSSVDETEWTTKLMKGREILLNGDVATAVKNYINPIIAHYESTYKNSPKQIFCSVNNQQTMMYLMSAAVAADLGKEKLPDDLMPKTFKAAGRKTLNPKAETIVLASTWAEAYYLKAYAAIELGKIEDAQKNLKKAVYLSPYNATYWAELGHTHQMLKNWETCVRVYTVAEDAADMSDEEYKNQDLARSWRGIGFAKIELGKLDEAEALFKKCLEVDPEDKKAENELGYIAQLREKNK